MGWHQRRGTVPKPGRWAGIARGSRGLAWEPAGRSSFGAIQSRRTQSWRLAEPVSGGAEAAGATFPTSPGSPSPAGAACSEPAAMPSWQRGGAAWDPCSPSLRPGRGSPPAVSAPPTARGTPFQTTPSFAAPFPGAGLRCAVGPRRVGDVVPARRLQVRAGGAAVPGSAPPPRPVPGPGRALLKQNLPLLNHLRAEPRRDGAGSASQPWRVSSSGLFGFEARTTTLR